MKSSFFQSKIFSLVANSALVLLLVFLLYQRAPDILHHFQAEGDPAPPFQIDVLEGKILRSEEFRRPMILVFWATWCGPCRIELSRINKMILANEIPADSVLAISSHEDIHLLRQVTKERNYQFLVGWDETGKISESFRVQVTPTLVLLTPDHKTQWMTSGFSLLLDYRLKRFIKSHVEILPSL